MVKKCEYPECEQEVSDWQNFCVEHYVKVSQEGLPEKKEEVKAEALREKTYKKEEQEQKEDKKESVMEFPVKDASELSEEQIRMMLQQEKMKMQQKEQVKEKETYVPKKIRKEFPVAEEVTEQQRLTIKMYALQSAVSMLNSMEYDNEFKGMIEDVRTLTAHFYRIIVEKNELV